MQKILTAILVAGTATVALAASHTTAPVNTTASKYSSNAAPAPMPRPNKDQVAGVQTTESGVDRVKETGPYVGLGLGFGWGGGSHDNFGFALGLNAGYNFSASLAGEFDYIHMPTGSVDGVDGSSNVFGLAGRLNIPFRSRMTFYGKAGFALVNNSVNVGGFGGASQTHFAALLGGGAEYKLTDKLGINGETDVTIGSDAADTAAVLFGASYKLNF